MEFKYLWSVATGGVNPFRKKPRDAAKYIQKLDGFTAIHSTPDGSHILWLFNSENNAKAARNLMRSKGMKCGNNICRFKWDGGIELIFDDPNFKEGK